MRRRIFSQNHHLIFVRMRLAILLIAITLFLQTSAFSQKAELCQGAYFTEAQGETFLDLTSVTSKVAWDARAAKIRAQIKEGMQLQTLPAKPTSQPIIYGKREMDGYTIENVAFESIPGFYVTGNLYRPLKKQRKYAGICVPMGMGIIQRGVSENRLRNAVVRLREWERWYLYGIW